MRYKLFILFFLLIQSAMILRIFPQKIQYKNYWTEVFLQVVFSVSKVNNMYNFFTDPANTGTYNYTTNTVFMVDRNADTIRKINISQKGSIGHLVSPINAARLSQIQSLSMSDTTFYNAIVRSEALYFLKTNPACPLIFFEVLNHTCTARTKGDTFVKEEKVNVLYSNYFTIDE